MIGMGMGGWGEGKEGECFALVGRREALTLIRGNIIMSGQHFEGNIPSVFVFPYKPVCTVRILVYAYMFKFQKTALHPYQVTVRYISVLLLR